MSRDRTALPLARAALALALAATAALPAHALYKVVGPDGKVTYTDRLPSPADGKVTPINPGGAVVADPNALPLELRQAAQRYPVTLVVVADCAPCDAARALLRQRGIPFAERSVVSEEDAEALQRLSGSRDAPTLLIGAQPLRGFSGESWNGYLDAAGYPRESRLPPGYSYAAAMPLAERRDAPRTPPRPTAEAAPPPAAPAAVAPAPGIRF